MHKYTHEVKSRTQTVETQAGIYMLQPLSVNQIAVPVTVMKPNNSGAYACSQTLL